VRYSPAVGKRKTLFFGSIISAVSLLVAPRVRGRGAGDARLRRQRGSLTAFGGTPCSRERGEAAQPAGGAGEAPPPDDPETARGPGDSGP
jgi:hypothetical protein